mgnify:CR=1 FL=1
MSDAQLASLQEEFRPLLARNTGILVPTRSNWKVAVAALKRQDCDVRNECLRQLAVTAGTLYALFASIERNAAGTEVTATGRVVNQDGVQVRPLAQAVAIQKGTFEEAARAALAQLLGKLELDRLSAVLGAVARPVATIQAPAPPPGLSPLRVAALATGGLAVAAGAVAVGFGVSAAGARGALPADGRLIDAEQVRAQRAVNQGATLALGIGIAAAALALAAVTSFGLSSPAANASVGVAAAPGGGAVVLGGVF